MTTRTTSAAREAKLDSLNREFNREHRRARASLVTSWVTLVSLALALAGFIGYVLGRASLP